MMIRFLCIALSFFLLKGTSAASDDSINAAIFEVTPDQKFDIEASLKTYGKLLTGKPQIIVFPEYAFTGFQVEDLDKYSITINSTGAVDGNITFFNKFAKDNGAYVVANVIEKADDHFYSTTVVVNGTDNIVAKYRKINTNSSETKLTRGSDIVTFEMSLLGKVGLISGDDILFENPANKILSDADVKTIIYTTAFRSFAPFRTALSVQQGYAQANGIILLVANLQDPTNGLSGSGVYYQNQVLSSGLDANTGTKILASNALKKADKRNVCQTPSKSNQVFTNFNVLGFNKGTDNPISKFNLTYTTVEWVSQNITANTNENGTDVCDGDFCCNFKVESPSWSKNEQYRIAVRGGDNSVCALLWCKQDGTECGYKLSGTTETKFSFIEISYKKSDRSFRPYTLKTDLTTIAKPEQTTYFCQSDDNVFFNTTKASFDNIVVFGIVTASGASSLNVLMGLQLMLLVTVLKFFFTNA